MLITRGNKSYHKAVGISIISNQGICQTCSITQASHHKIKSNSLQTDACPYSYECLTIVS